MPENHVVDSDKPSTQDMSFASDIVISVVRDRAISSLYGYQMSRTDKCPSVYEVFKEPYAARIEKRLKKITPNPLEVALYSGMGDLIGQLSRLLIICREEEFLAQYVASANREIGELGLEICRMNDDNYVRHMRNAVMHYRISIELGEGPFQTRVVFSDGPRDENKAVLISVDAEQLSRILDVLIEGVFLRYFKDVGWEIR